MSLRQLTGMSRVRVAAERVVDLPASLVAMRGGEADVACVVCGAALNPRTAEFTAVGMRCARCGLAEGAREAAAELGLRDERERERSLSRSASRIALVHGVIWGGIVIASAGGHDAALRAWLAPLTVLVLVLAFGLARRKPLAYRAAMSLNLSATALVLASGLWRVGVSSPGMLLMMAAVPASAAALLWLLRVAFKPGPAAVLTHPV